MLKQHSPQIEESLLHTRQRQQEAGRQQQSPHPSAAHARLASCSPQTASGQRREATTPVTASGHQQRRGGSRDRDRLQQPPWRARENYCLDRQRANSRDQSRQSDLGGAGSGQKTANGHTETTRANAMKSLAVQRLPTIAPRPFKGKQQSRQSTPTAPAIETIHAHSDINRLTVNGKRRDSMSNKTGHESHPTKSGLNAPSWLPKPKIGKPGRNPNGSGPPKTPPPHHLAGSSEMRRERQPRTASLRRPSHPITSQGVQR